jgi:hypothetical protein
MDEVTTLYRPAGRAELDLFREGGFQKFPPRFSHQPIFYRVLSEAYAREMAEKWNTRDEQSGFAGYVTKFHVRSDFIRKFPVKQVGDTQHCELWIRSTELEEMNRNLVGKIEVVAEFLGPSDLTSQP